MSGYSGVQYDDDQQQAAAPKVNETWDAVTESRNGATSLGSAQESSFWGQESGPVAMRTRATDMFNTISELLAAETRLLQEFEAYMHQAMKEFTGTEYTNETQFKQLAADRVNAFLKNNHTVGVMTTMFARLGVNMTAADLASGLIGKSAAAGAGTAVAAGATATQATPQQTTSAPSAPAPAPSSY